MAGAGPPLTPLRQRVRHHVQQARAHQGSRGEGCGFEKRGRGRLGVGALAFWQIVAAEDGGGAVQQGVHDGDFRQARLAAGK